MESIGIALTSGAATGVTIAPLHARPVAAMPLPVKVPKTFVITSAHPTAPVLIQLFLNGQLSDLSASKGEAELKVDPSSGKVALEVVQGDVAVGCDLGCTDHLDGVGELACRPSQPLADLLSSLICLALISNRGVGGVASEGDLSITSHVCPQITRDDRGQFTGVDGLWLLHDLQFLRGTRVYADLKTTVEPPSGGKVKTRRDGLATAARVWNLSSVEPKLMDVSAVLAIGEFSRITHLSIKTLRRYHEAGLLEPAIVDRHTGYRYYSLEQVPTAQVIHCFRELGMPVREVGELVAITDPHARAAIISQHLRRVETQLDQTRAAVVSLRTPRTQSGLSRGRAAPDRGDDGCCSPRSRDLGDVLGWYDAAMGELDTVLSSVGAVPCGPPGVSTTTSCSPRSGG